MRRRTVTMYYASSLILEIGSVAAFASGTWRIFPAAWRTLAATIAFVVVISLWSAFLMRQAPKRLPMPLLAISVAALASGSVAILVFAELGLFATILALLAVGNISLLVVLWLRNPELINDIPSAQHRTSKPARPVNTRVKNAGGSGRPARRTTRRQPVGPEEKDFRGSFRPF